MKMLTFMVGPLTFSITYKTDFEEEERHTNNIHGKFGVWCLCAQALKGGWGQKRCIFV